ncbi:MAG: glycosyltransferase family 4 protein [Panacibacter sp.]
MRIAIIVDTFPAVSETFISNKVMHLANRGHQLFVICNKKNETLFNQLFSNNKNVTVVLFSKQKLLQYLGTHPAESIAALSKGKDFQKYVYRKFKVNTINECNADIVHFGFSGLGVALLEGIPDIKAKIGVSCRGSAEYIKLLAYHDRKKQIVSLFQQADTIHCVSENMRQTILPYCSKPEKIFINYPSVDATKFKRSKEYIAHSPVIILSVGRLVFQKGYLIGLLAVRKLKEFNKNFQWQIVAGGAHDEIIFHINELGLNDYVKLLGPKINSEVAELYNEADIFFLPSVSEGIANVVLEAMSMELPVVSTRCGGMEEVITHGKNGLLADVYDYNALAENLLQLFNAESLRKTLGAAARKRVTEQFEISMQAAKFEQVYKSLLQ